MEINGDKWGTMPLNWDKWGLTISLLKSLISINHIDHHKQRCSEMEINNIPAQSINPH